MRSLSTKLTIAFGSVALLATVLMLLVVSYSTFSGFDQFVSEFLIPTVTPAPANSPPSSNNNDNKNNNDDRSRNNPPRRFEPDTPAGNFEDTIYRGLAIGIGAGVLLALGVGYILARQLIRPIRRLTHATGALADGALGHQVPVTTRDEIGELTQAFNQMSLDMAQSNQLRRQLTADIAHDLRTPLTVIAGYTEGLSEGTLKESPHTYRVMHEQVQLLQLLLDDLRTLSLADAGELTLSKRPTDPRALLERTAVAYLPQAERLSIALNINAPNTLPLANVDVDRMVQVLNNLVSNALRYTDEGGTISLSASAEKQTVLWHIQDSGSGIDPADLPKIFERSYRADPARTRSGDDSSGLGLAIARAIVEAHGGTISAESQLGVGTTFHIQIPI
jgi:signal transduction histidine kinase